MQLSLKNKTAIITGVSRKKGIGTAIAKNFAARGADLFLTSWPQYDKTMPWGHVDGEFEETVREIKSFGVKCEVLEIDLSEPTAATTIFEKAGKTFGSIDILVNNAVCDIETDIFSISPEILHQHFSVNINANVFLSSELIRSYKKQDGGRIINLTSGQGLTPMPSSLPYAMSKAAIEALTLSLSVTAGARGITVNAIDPGPTDTGWMSENLLNDLKARSPFNRVGLPADAANLAAFLASDDGGWITGQILRSRGGS
jgi:3-oxoacyl-[acyl-carrier protein] reductase